MHIKLVVVVNIFYTSNIIRIGTTFWWISILDESERKIRRILLKPLLHHSRRKGALKISSELTANLDDRAVGEQTLQETRDKILSGGTKRASRFIGTKSRTIKVVALIKVIYASRRITRSEYIFMASSSVEDRHEKNWLDGKYNDVLGPLAKAMQKIERDAGLTSEQYWPIKQAPKNFRRLSSQYNEYMEAKFVELLHEFHLPDIAALVEHEPDEFARLRERGRRSIHHKEEYILALQDAVMQCEEEAHLAATVGAHSAAITSLGAGLEGLLLLRCVRSPSKAARIAQTLDKRLRPKRSSNLNTWTFEALIEVCLRAGWLTHVETPKSRLDAAALAHVIRNMRNYVHPAKLAREKPWTKTDEREYIDAMAIYTALSSSLGKINHRQSPSVSLT